MTSLIAYKEYLLNNMDSALYRAIHEENDNEARIHRAAYLSFREALEVFQQLLKKAA